jgi:hypothetical protein
VRQDSLRKKRKPIELGPASSILILPLLPLLGVAALLSIPYSSWLRRRSRRQEQLFEDTMRSCGRALLWDELEIKRREQNGFIVVEWLSFKGPSRWWWIDDAISEAGIYKVTEENAPPNFYVPIDKVQWKTRYTGPGGKATLICATKEQKETVMTGRFCFKEGANALLVAPFLANADLKLETTSQRL